MMTSQIPLKKAFTLMEIMIVVTVVGLISAFAIPNYYKSIERTKRKNAENNLRTIWGAELMYRQANGTYAPYTWGPSLNADLSLNILPNDGFGYTCGTVGGTEATAYICTATREGNPMPYFLRLTEAPLSATNPSCVPGAIACP